SIDELLPACGLVITQAGRRRVLLGIGRIERVKRCCKDWMARDVIPPVVECHAPRIRARISAKTGQTMSPRLITEPAAVLLPHRAVRRFNLRMMKDRLAKQQIAVGRPYKIVQRMMRILRAEAAQQYLLYISPIVAVSVLQKRQVRHVGDIDSSITQLERQRHVQIAGKNS